MKQGSYRHLHCPQCNKTVEVKTGTSPCPCGHQFDLSDELLIRMGCVSTFYKNPTPDEEVYPSLN